MKRQHERRIRGGIIMAELGPHELDAFLAECVREGRTSGFLAGRIIADWLKQHDGESRSPDDRRAE